MPCPSFASRSEHLPRCRTPGQRPTIHRPTAVWARFISEARGRRTLSDHRDSNARPGVGHCGRVKSRCGCGCADSLRASAHRGGYGGRPAKPFTRVRILSLARSALAGQRPSKDDVLVPSLVPPAIVAGSLSRSAQPWIPVSAGARLRPWLRADAPALAAAFEDPAIQRWHARRADSTDEASGWIERWRRGWTNESDCHWAVVEPDTDVLLGRVAFKELNLQDGTAELAYWIVAAARGQGLCSLSVASLCNWAFEESGFHRIELEHSVANAASCRVAAKAGFRDEGTRRGAALHPDGWHDMHLHARLRSDQVAT